MVVGVLTAGQAEERVPSGERFTYTRLVVVRSSTEYEAGDNPPPLFFSLCLGDSANHPARVGG